MKKILVLALFASTFAPALALACSPIPASIPLYTVQKTRLTNMLNDDVIVKEIAKYGHEARIKSIDVQTSRIELTNGCSFSVVRDLNAENPSQCGDLLPFKIVDTVCPI